MNGEKKMLFVFSLAAIAEQTTIFCKLPKDFRKTIDDMDMNILPIGSGHSINAYSNYQVPIAFFELLMCHSYN